MAASWIILLCNLQNRRLNICHNLDQNIISCTNIAIHKNNRKKSLKPAKIKSYSPAATAVFIISRAIENQYRLRAFFIKSPQYISYTTETIYTGMSNKIIQQNNLEK